MLIATDTLDRIFLKDEYKLRNIDASGILVFDLYDNGKIGIYQASDIEETNLAFEQIDDSVELDLDEAILAFEQIANLLKEAQKNGNSLPTQRVIYQSPGTGRTIG